MTEKVWFITGTSRGFGREWAIAALERGDKVAATARNIATLDDLAEKYGEALLPIRLDVTDRAADFAAVKQAHDHFGRLDIVVNNAGYGHFGFVEELSEQDARDQLETNVFGALWITQAALPYLRESKHAAILNMVSAGAFIFSPAVSMYSAAKAAMVSFTRSMAAEFASQGIRVNALAPGSVDTDMVRGNPPEFIEVMKASALLGRIADPAEMIGPALLLVSDAGSFITGQTIFADGGMAAR